MWISVDSAFDRHYALVFSPSANINAPSLQKSFYITGDYYIYRYVKIKFVFTKHAVVRMMEIGLSKGEIKEIVMRGMKFGPDSRNLMHARMQGVEVVFDRKHETVRVITIFYKR